MENGIPLTKLHKGDAATIVSLSTRKIQQLRKLMVFGIFPGAMVKVLQTFPAFVLQIEYTQLALDREIAEKIIVNKYPEKSLNRPF